jgi:GNAT superfamily N-acetyltransferase
MLRACQASDFETIYTIVNDAAMAYRGVIPPDCWHEPYMTRAELEQELASGIVFWGFEEAGELAGVMGFQDKREVALIRHAYVRTQRRKQGIGTILLHHLEGLTTKPILIGTWADAGWAIRFYEKNGYRLVSAEEKARLLKKHWMISNRQIKTPVVLASETWFANQKP